MQFFEGAARIVQSGDKGVSPGVRVGCLLLLVLFFVALRRWMLMHYAHKPGAVDVKKLVASAPDTEPQLEGLTAQLRKQLSETNLYPPAALPAEAPADNFLDLVGDVDLEPKKLGTSLLRLFSRLRPKIAYTVSGVLRVRAQEPCCGVTVTVTSYAIRGSRTEAIWRETWEQAVQAAGYWVMATLVPVTRAGRRPPWQGWRGRDLPPELFAAYQEARELSQERKFDDALDRYYEAMRLDPTNLYLRTQIAGTQEHLWLHLDALETYYGAILLDGLTSEQRERRMRPGPLNDLRRIFWRRYRWWRSGLLEARYRYAVVLGVAERTADQWCRRDEAVCPRRAHARREIRKALTPALASRYWRTLAALDPPGVEKPVKKHEEAAEAATEWLKCELGEGRREIEIVRVVLQLACQEEMRQLAKDYPRFTHRLGLPASRGHGTLTRASLRINRDVWGPLRLAWAHSGAGKHQFTNPTGLPWPTPVNRLESMVEQAKTGWPRSMRRPKRSRGWRRWQDSYNAACVYAVAMNGVDEGKQKEELADAAVDELEDAAHTDQSGFHPLARSWLLTEDPDLEELRQTDRFIRFERETYPHAAPDRHRPKRPLWAEMLAYDQELLRGCADVMEHTWRLRRKATPAESHLLAQWFSSETEVWRCVHRVAANQGRNWRDRAKLLHSVSDLADATLLAECGLPSSLPELDDLLDDAAWSEFADAKSRVEAFAEMMPQRLQKLSDAVDEGPSNSPCLHSPIRRSAQWLTAVRQNDAAPGAVQQACSDHEVWWRALRNQLDLDENNEQALSQALRRFHAP
ncbi:hypothetical protein U9R90_00660 [Streptomyces sp. E11-3]|uniref:hypothetical protein n=1 Tax=Streptomyces sp. E11-3 TaxID=3110112 RepID=UPI0039810864